MKQFQVLSLDVWGNSIDGFEVNDLRETGFFFESNELPEFETVVKILKKESWLNKRYKFTNQYPYEDSITIEYRKTGEPMYEIRETTKEFYGNWFFNDFLHSKPAIVYRIYNSGRTRKIQG